MKYRDLNFHLRIPHPELSFGWRGIERWLPSRGNVLFTLVMIAVLLWAQSVGAVPFRAERAASTGTVAYQGRLADSSGNPLTQTLNMSFRLYSAATGGAPLWTEQWTGSNGVKVSDGLFNVMLGSLTPIAQSVITGNSNLFLGITVGTDDEMTPRVQLGSVPFAVQALTVPDGSITKAKLAGDVSLTPPDGSITTAKIADGSVTQSKLGSDINLSFLHLMDDPPIILRYDNVEPTNQWGILDLSQWIPADAQAVILTILVDIDRENSGEFRVGFRHPGSSVDNWKILAVDGHYTPGHVTWTHNQGVVGVSNGSVEWISSRPGGDTKGSILVTLVGFYQ